MDKNELYQPENLEALADLLVAKWRPTEDGDYLYEPVERAKYLGARNRQGLLLVSLVITKMEEACVS